MLNHHWKSIPHPQPKERNNVCVLGGKSLPSGSSPRCLSYLFLSLQRNAARQRDVSEVGEAEAVRGRQAVAILESVVVFWETVWAGKDIAGLTVKPVGTAVKTCVYPRSQPA